MQHLTRQELKALLAAVVEGSKFSHETELSPERKRLMVLVCYHHGLRVSELINLTGAQIRGGFVSVQRLKGSLKTTQAYATDPDPELDESAALAELASRLKPREKAFPMSRSGFAKMLKAAGRRAGISEGSRYNNKLHPHALKHSIAMHTIGAGIENTRQWLGHKSIASTGAYLRKSDEEATLAIREHIKTMAHATGV